MKGRWEVTSNYIAGRMMYVVYRKLDVDVVVHGGNREYANKYTSNMEECQALADKLNKEQEGAGMGVARRDRRLAFLPNTEDLGKEWCEIEKACEPILEYLKKNPYIGIFVKVGSIEVVQITGRTPINTVD